MLVDSTDLIGFMRFSSTSSAGGRLEREGGVYGIPVYRAIGQLPFRVMHELAQCTLACGSNSPSRVSYAGGIGS